MSDGALTTTTSLLAERLVEDIGKPIQLEGTLSCFKNFSLMCNDSCAADCGANKKHIGYQE